MLKNLIVFLAVSYNKIFPEVNLIIPLKKGIMFFTLPLGLSVCVSVWHHVCGEMAGLSNMVSSEVNAIYKNLKMQH